MEKVISKDELIKICPAVISPQSPSVKSRYVHINTMDVIEQVLNSGGWNITKAIGKDQYGYHQVILTQNDSFENTDRLGKLFPQIKVISSHDGTTKFQMLMGIFRLICDNGLVAPMKNTSETNTVKHIGIDTDYVNGVIENTLSNGYGIIGKISKMRNTDIFEDAKIDLINTALLTKGRIHENEATNFVSKLNDKTYESICQINRPQDAGNNIWNVFNTVQENVLRGNYTVYGEKNRKARPVTDFRLNDRINTAMFEKVLELV